MFNLQYIDMEKEPVSYEIPRVVVVKILAEGVFLTLSNPDFNNPFTDGGEDW